jgi:glycerol-3-phosphate acyltransferase PlsX
MPKIAIDVMGGDHAPDQIIEGCIKASSKTTSKLVLVGNEAIINEKLKNYSYDTNKIEIVDAQEIIDMHDAPVQAIREKKNSSMVVGLSLLKNKEVDAFVSAGNTGALLAGATLIVGRIKGVERPALAPLLPNKKGYSLLIDCGANMDCKPSYLLQFARMGTIYMQQCLNVSEPKVGLINIGVEAEKGNQLVKDAYKLLSEDDLINFAGNVEARDIPNGEADILVCDAFVGNVVLKFMEGFGLWMFSALKNEFTSSLKSKLGALLLKKGIYNIKNKFDYSEQGGAPLLGVNGLVVKTHGSSKEKEIYHTLLQTDKFIDNRLVEKIANNLITC